MAEDTPVRLALTLAFAGLVSGLVLVSVYELTLPRITRNKAEALRRAVFEVVPGADRMEKIDTDLYGAFDDKGFVGYAIAGQGAGFQDNISLLYGYDPGRKRVGGMRVLESRETPGLGDKIFKDQDFVGNFRDLAVEPPVKVVMTGRKAPNEVDGITGATISSKAVVRIINETNARHLPKLPSTPPTPTPKPPTPKEGANE